MATLTMTRNHRSPNSGIRRPKWRVPSAWSCVSSGFATVRSTHSRRIPRSRSMSRKCAESSTGQSLARSGVYSALDAPGRAPYSPETEEAKMRMTGVREFRAHLSRYLSSERPVLLTRHGRVSGPYLPLEDASRVPFWERTWRVFSRLRG